MVHTNLVIREPPCGFNSLCEAGANLQPGYIRPMMHAAQHQNINAIEALHSAGAQVNAADPHGRTALMFAAELGYTAVCNALIELGANLNAKGHNKGTALFVAAAAGRSAVVQRLCDAGADVERSNFQGITP
jgi:ankyrin repeat protein